MAKSDLLKEAIADAKAVKETALANAKIALQEAFEPKIKSMLSAKLSEELMDEQDDEVMDVAADELEGGDDMDMDMGMEDEMDMDAGEPMDVGDIEIDTDMDGEIDFTGDIMTKPGANMEDDMGDMGDMDDMEGDMEGEMDMDMEDDGLDLAEIISELEQDLEDSSEGMKYEEEAEVIPEAASEEKTRADNPNPGTKDGYKMNESQSIDELIEAILAEDETEENEAQKSADSDPNEPEPKQENRCEGLKRDLTEAYNTVGHLKSVINEVNLLNAKLLYTNKLFRNFDLNEGQKMKVIENFDRAGNTREAKLVFTTLAESFQKPSRGKRKVVKESKSLASKPVATTAPSKQTTQVLSEGFEQANRWKKLAGLIK